MAWEWRTPAVGPSRGRGALGGGSLRRSGDPMTMDKFVGVDLAWRDAARRGGANETGVVLLDGTGRVLEAGWTVGVAATSAWIQAHSGDCPCVVMVDAPLVVSNPTGQRRCEQEVGQRYGRWKVSANSTNTRSAGRAGIELLACLEQAGWAYDSGVDGPATRGRTVSECYPYTALVGAQELGYDTERPRYKRKPRASSAREWRRERAKNCDELVQRLARLRTVEPPMDLRSHWRTRDLVDTPSPLDDGEYKHREDLLDAAIAAWTALLWVRSGFDRCQVLGADQSLRDGRLVPTIIAPARPAQRRGLSPPIDVGGGGTSCPSEHPASTRVVG